MAGAVGGAAGYLWYFGSGGWQGAVWMLLGLAVSLGLAFSFILAPWAGKQEHTPC